MKRLFLSGLLSLMLIPLVAKADDYFNPNGGLVTSPTDIHATTFTNYGTFDLGLFLNPITHPFETWDTQTFDNKGQMTCYPGWWFDNQSSTDYSRRLAANFVNENPGVIQALDPWVFSTYPNFSPCSVALYSPSYLKIWATNITNGAGIPLSGGASLIVGANGGLELVGTNVNLSRSGLEVLPVWDEPTPYYYVSTNSFSSDVAIYDSYWAQSNFSLAMPLDSAGLWNGFIANAQGVPEPPSQPTPAPPFSLFFPYADSYINVGQDGYLPVTFTNRAGAAKTIVLMTNIVKGAVFVSAPPEFNVKLGFVGPYPNDADTIGVLMSVQLSNAATTLPDSAYIYVEDRFASQPTPPPPFRGIQTNLIGCPAITGRPGNYSVFRSPIPPGSPGNNGYPDPDFFTSSGNGLIYTNDIGPDSVTNAVVNVGDYAAYSAFLDNVVSRPPAVPGGTVTNLPGRIRIFADTLDLSQARLRGEGEITLQTSRLIASSNAVVDCENLGFNLTSASGNLHIQNLSKDEVQRLRGPIYLWSAEWSNSVSVVITNNYTFTTNDSGARVAVQTPITNQAYVVYHTLMLDADYLQTILPVNVFDLITHSTNVVINDNMSVIQNVAIDAQSLTLNGNLSLPGYYYPPNPTTLFSATNPAIQNWTYPLASNLLYFTNHGTFTIPNEAHFGDDGPRSYQSFVNTGMISAASIQLKSAYLENSGLLQAQVGSLIMQGGSGKLQNGNSTSAGEMQFLFGNLKFDHYQALAHNSAINFSITNSLSDAGADSGNVLEAQNGFNLYLKPPVGDLLGTTLRTTAPSVPSVFLVHVWAGADRGLSAAGYTNNVAVGKLVLARQSPNPRYYFTGAGVSNALYVDYLDLSQLPDYYANEIQIDPSLTIYYAAAALGFTPPPTNGVPQEPEEYLNGQFGGHLRWVSSFAGPNSSVDVIIDGKTVKVNRALRYSLIIDSDGDGIPNGLDPTPFDTAPVASLATTNPPPTVLLSWNGIAQKVYQIQAKTNAVSSNWQTLFYYTNSAATNGKVTVEIPLPPGAPRQFYRVGVVVP